MNPPRHFSVFDLDTWFASSTAERASAEGLEIAAHVASCAACRRHIEALEADTTPLAVAMTASRRQRLMRLVPAAPLVGVLALAAALVIYVRTRSTADEASYVGVKGAPAAQVLVRSEGRLRVWNGTSPVRSGDVLAVRVACESFEHVAVVADGEGGIARAWDGPCPAPATDTTLPFTLVVDGAPGREHFVVVLSRGRLEDPRLDAAVRTAERTDQAWTLAFDFAKED